jgi:prevent-host-death family protein
MVFHAQQAAEKAMKGYLSWHDQAFRKTHDLDQSEVLILRTSSCTLSVKAQIMTSITVTHARANLFKLLDQTAQSHEPIQITGRRQNGVLLSEDDFRAMQETLYLLSVPGMKASLRKARKAPLKAYSKTRPW